MTALLLRSLAARKLRTALTGLAVLLGVAMVAGTFIQTDRIRNAFDDILGTANAGIDVVVTHRAEFESAFGDLVEIDAGLLERVRGVPGVATAAGELESPAGLVVDGRLLESDGLVGGILMTQLPQPFDPLRVVAGRAPREPGEVGVDRQTAREEGIAPGDRVEVATSTGTQPARVTGTFTYGDVDRLAGARLISAVLADVQTWTDREGSLTSVVVEAEDGVEPEELAAQIRETLPRDVEVRTGEANAAKTSDDINDSIGTFLLPALLALAGAAVIVGGFIIFNTYAITVAQRMREFALLRTLGASRRQLLVAVIGEAAVLGAVASVAGIAAGAAFAELLTRLFDASGFALPATGIPIAARTIVIALAVGIGISVVSALVPALRAMRVPPGIALRESALMEPRSGRFGPWAAGILTVLGTAAVVAGALGDGPAETRLGGIGGGAMLLFVGLALGSRWIVRPFARLLGALFERLAPVPGRLARENAERNPGRTAVTAASLMVGLALVVFIAVFADGLKASITGSIDQLIRAEHVITGESSTQPVPSGAESAIARVPGVAAIAPIYFDQVRVNERRKPNTVTDTVEGMDAAELRQVYAFDWVDGSSDAALDGLRGGGAVVEEQFAKVHDLERGEGFRITTPSGGSARLRVLGIYRDPQILQGLIVERATFDSISSMNDPFLVLVRREAGVGEAEMASRLERALEAFPTAEPKTLDEYRDDIQGQLDQLVYLLYALLAMSVAISLVGIANTLFLSVHERTREVGLLRAIGADGRLIRRLVRYESVITAVLGGLLGTLAGVGLGWVATEALSDFGMRFSLPWVQLVVFPLVAAAVGVIAAALPARRAARLDVLAALREE